MGRTKSDDIGSDESGRLYEPEPGEQEQDPVSSLHDTEEETGDSKVSRTPSASTRVRPRSAAANSTQQAGGSRIWISRWRGRPNDGSNVSAFARANWWQLLVDPLAVRLSRLTVYAELRTSSESSIASLLSRWTVHSEALFQALDLPKKSARPSDVRER